MAGVTKHNRSFFGNKFSTGTFVKIYALHLLTENKFMYAAEIKQHMQDSLGWSPSDALLLQVLQHLTENGYLTRWWEHGRTNHGKRFYRMTEEGYKYYHWLTDDHRQSFVATKEIIDKAMRIIYKK